MTFRITTGEALWLRRRRAGYTTAQWAALHRCTVDRLYKAEHDQQEVPVPLKHTIRIFQRAIPAPITKGEFSAVCRRRTGESMRAVAAARGVSRVTQWKQEHDLTSTTPELAEWWQRRGPLVLPTATLPTECD